MEDRNQGYWDEIGEEVVVVVEGEEQEEDDEESKENFIGCNFDCNEMNLLLILYENILNFFKIVFLFFFMFFVEIVNLSNMIDNVGNKIIV